ncbi:putative RDD family membrane protein YckC [Paenibacillus brasilensis]|uniref:RDD family membrane protein YckC n=2 Tax=Paenibacillus brasilensis TaxID=128574 RepID=A0ABU0KVP1_9BACL|nr:putative RDD family membrane protein YckC [Paenibacillus brasilensis]
MNSEGKRLGFWHASGRNWIEAISFVTIYIIYIVVAFTAKKQGVYDLCANTLVVNTSNASEQAANSVAHKEAVSTTLTTREYTDAQNVKL